MFSSVSSFGLTGIACYPVTVEADVSRAFPCFEIVGLPDAAVKESKDRVRSAMKNCGMEFPSSRVVVNLAPADTKKTGAIYDLPIGSNIQLVVEPDGRRRWFDNKTKKEISFR